jgi:hypothetical protein
MQTERFPMYCTCHYTRREDEDTARIWKVVEEQRLASMKTKDDKAK